MLCVLVFCVLNACLVSVSVCACRVLNVSLVVSLVCALCMLVYVLGVLVCVKCVFSS